MLPGSIISDSIAGKIGKGDAAISLLFLWFVILLSSHFFLSINADTYQGVGLNFSLQQVPKIYLQTGNQHYKTFGAADRAAARPFQVRSQVQGMAFNIIDVVRIADMPVCRDQ
jgi:hypothetical protein